MSKPVIRSLCLLALLASIVVRYQTIRSRDAMMVDFDVGAAITKLIRESGLSLRKNPTKPPKVLSSAIYFQRPECGQVSVVMPYFINAEALPLLARVIKPGFDRHFFYLDGSWKSQDRVSMFLEWAKHAAFDIFGASRYFVVKKAIVVSEPPDCRPAVAIDWRLVWDRARHRNAASAKSTRSSGPEGT